MLEQNSSYNPRRRTLNIIDIGFYSFLLDPAYSARPLYKQPDTCIFFVEILM